MGNFGLEIVGLGISDAECVLAIYLSRPLEIKNGYSCYQHHKEIFLSDLSFWKLLSAFFSLTPFKLK